MGKQGIMQQVIVITTGPMAPPRRYRGRNNRSGDWREGEIRDLARQAAAEVLKDHLLQLDKLADGAQASLNTAILLHGDPAWGIRGAVPEIKERLTALEVRVDDIPALRKEIEELKAKQGRILRGCKRAFRILLVVDEDGKPALKRLVALAGAAGGAGYFVNWTLSHLQAARAWLVRWIWK